MIKGVRRPDEVSNLGLSHRLLLRVGALLKKNLAFTVALLESARPGSALEGFLLDPALAQSAETLDAANLAALLKNHSGVDPATLTMTTADDKVRVVCLQDEFDAGDGWGERVQAAPPVAPATIGSTALAENAPADAPPNSLFSRAELDRHRLKLATAASPSERMEAMRTLVLSPLTPAEKMDAVIQGLSDREPSVRAEAAGLLPNLGGDPDISAALSALNSAESGRRLSAADRLLKMLQHPVRDIETGCIAVCALAMLKAEPGAQTPEAKAANAGDPLPGKLLEVLRSCAPVVGRNPARLAEIVRVVAAMIAASTRHGASSREVDAVVSPAHRLMRAFGSAVPKDLLPALAAERERASDPISEGFMIQLILEVAPHDAPEMPALMETAAAFLARDVEEGRDSRAIGARLAQRGAASLPALCAAFPKATTGAQKYMLLLFDEIFRNNKVAPEIKESVGTIILQTIESAGKGMRMAAMECRVACDQDLSEELRRKLTEAILNSLNDFTFSFDIDKVEGIVSHMGLPAIQPLLDRLQAGRRAEERVRAVRLLGELSAHMKAPRGQIARLQQGINDVLRSLQNLSLDPLFPDRGELLSALGKLASSPAASRDADAVITRTLLDAAKSPDLKVMPRALEGLTYVAASRKATPDLIHQAAELLLHVLEGAVLDITTASKFVGGEQVIEISGGESVTNFLPIVLKGMARIATSTSCPPATVRNLTEQLLARFKKVSSGELVWGPANSLLLVQSLKELGCHKGLAPEVRLEILRALAPRHVQTPIMHALTEILTADDTHATAVGALTIGHAILGRRGREGQFAFEDREEILKALWRICNRKTLGAISPEAQQKALLFRKLAIEEIFKGLKDMVPGSLEALTALRDNPNISKDLRDDVGRRLKDYLSLATQ